MGFIQSGLATQALGTGMSIAAAKQQQEAQRLAAQWNATVAQQEAAVAREQASRAREQGEIEADARLREYSKLKGEQRAAYGASGVDANWGSAAAVQADTMAWGEYEAQKEIYNYGLSAWGYEQQARNSDMQAKAALAGAPSGNLGMWTAGISGATDMFNTYNRWKK